MARLSASSVKACNRILPPLGPRESINSKILELHCKVADHDMRDKEWLGVQ